MKIWTYQEMSTKVINDLDLQDEIFVTPDEMRGYFNEAITEAGAEIYVLNQDYFLSKYFVPVVQGTMRYSLPENIFANKIRSIMYINGSVIYEIYQFRRRGKFELIPVIDQYELANDYQYLLWNDVPGQAVAEFHPLMRDTAILAPVANIFAPIQLMFLRDCNRIPVVGEYCNPEIVATTQVSIGSDTIQTYSGTKTYGLPAQGLPGATPGSSAYITGSKLKFSPGPNGTLPTPLVEGTVYYAIATGSGLIKIATTLANALAGTAIDLTTVGTVYFTIHVAATTAIINGCLIDIPEFATFIMQWVKCRCLEKESDPRLPGAVETLSQQRKMMVDTLTKGIDDDNDQIQADFSFYRDMN